MKWCRAVRAVILLGLVSLPINTFANPQCHVEQSLDPKCLKTPSVPKYEQVSQPHVRIYKREVAVLLQGLDMRYLVTEFSAAS